MGTVMAKGKRSDAASGGSRMKFTYRAEPVRVIVVGGHGTASGRFRLPLGIAAFPQRLLESKGSNQGAGVDSAEGDGEPGGGTAEEATPQATPSATTPAPTDRGDKPAPVRPLRTLPRVRACACGDRRSG